MTTTAPVSGVPGIEGQEANVKIKLLVFIFAGMTVLGVRAHAHHSFAGTYLGDQRITIEADVLKFLYRNPHSFLELETKDATGKPITWAAEWGAAAQLANAGVQRDSLRPGDHVIAVGSPGRNPEDHRLHMSEVTRPSDGWSWKGDFH